MKLALKHSIFFGLIFSTYVLSAQTNNITVWLTNNDRSALFQQQPNKLIFNEQENSNPTIIVDEARIFQQMDGFGFALTGGSAQHIIHARQLLV
jgi:glucosylceramidase